MKPDIKWADTEQAAELSLRYNVTPLTPALRVDPQFEADVLEGLDDDQKHLPSIWLYDRRGSELFEEITEVAEYYPTRTETRLLAGLARDFPHLAVQPVVADFTQPFALPGGTSDDSAGNLGFFPGSTIGNFTPDAAVDLMKQLGRTLGPRSRLLIGVDTTQDPALLIPAYDDAAGVTAAFNLNLLDRINRELDGDFDRRDFRHLARHDPQHGRVEMHLVSQREQEVHVRGRTFMFAAGETIHTENCYKYSPTQFLHMAHAAHWRCERSWQDGGRTGFTVYLLRRDA